MLHRGIVLTRDCINHLYLVQFERKELGCEFCPDIEVASHGVPEIIVSGTEIALDGSYLGAHANLLSSYGSLPYGTTYGPLVGKLLLISPFFYIFVFMISLRYFLSPLVTQRLSQERKSEGYR